MQSHSTPEQYLQAIAAIKQDSLEKACNKLIGPRRSAREIKRVTDRPKVTTLWYCPQEYWLNHKAIRVQSMHATAFMIKPKCERK
jgi:hypothetical protein